MVRARIVRHASVLWRAAMIACWRRRGLSHGAAVATMHIGVAWRSRALVDTVGLAALHWLASTNVRVPWWRRHDSVVVAAAALKRVVAGAVTVAQVRYAWCHLYRLNRTSSSRTGEQVPLTFGKRTLTSK